MRILQPYDGALIADIVPHTAADLEAKIHCAAAVFAHRTQWIPLPERIEILRRLSTLVARDQQLLARLIAREGGKPLTDAHIEVARAINGIEIAIAHLHNLAGTEVPMGLTPASSNRWAFTTRVPIGPVAAVSAFNHPLNLIVHQVVPAIATGCPVLIKPAPVTPLTCLHFVKLVHEAGLPEPWCQSVILEDNALAQTLATDSRIAFCSFIGSARVGWHLRQQLPPGTRFALEHGGAAPVLIDRSANLDAVLEPLVKGAYYHAGQVCVSVQRVFIHEELKDDLVARLTARVATLRIGDPTLPETEIGPLIAPREVDRIEGWINDACIQGATLAAGGSRIGERLYRPTVLVEPHPASMVSTHEIFGPVACIYGFTDLEEAVTRANALPFAFQGAVFSTNIDQALKAANLLSGSAVMINDHSAFRTDWMPFTGHHHSGFGVGGIPYTMEDMMQSKMIVLKHS